MDRQTGCNGILWNKLGLTRALGRPLIEHGNLPSGFIKPGNFITEELSNYQGTPCTN
jgi:hypothetical protein